jgi:hypothetical protein
MCVSVSKEFVAANQHLKYLQKWPDLDPVDFFLFRKAKEVMAGLSFNSGSLKKASEGGHQDHHH